MFYSPFILIKYVPFLILNCAHTQLVFSDINTYFMFKKGPVNNVFSVKNKMDLLRIKKRAYIFSSLSYIESIPNINRVIYSSIGVAKFSRSSFKFRCAISGKYGSTVGNLPIGRFVAQKWMLFSELSFTSKKSW